MKKKIAIICAFVLLIMSVAQSVGAINVIMNSAMLKFPDQEPVIENGTTLVPIRAIAEALGLEVTWDDPTDTVVLKKDNFFVELVIGSTVAKTSSGVKELAVAPKIINGRTMVPLRFIAEEMGLTVLWNDEYQRVIINGQVDTQTIVTPPVEETPSEAEDATQPEEDSSDVTEDSTQPLEEETEFVDDALIVTVGAQSSSIIFEIPPSFDYDDTDSEESFAYRSLDAFDAQHKYNWEIVTSYESYANESGTDGIVIIVQEYPAYEGEVYDVARATDEYPERPERPEVDFGYIMSEATRLIYEQMYAEREVELPENYAEMSEEEHMEALGFESAEEMSEYMSGIAESFDMMQIPEYAEYAEWQMADNEYKQEAAEIDGAKAYAIRMFSQVYGELGDDVWAELFSSNLNTDEEVRYENVEILDINGKKIVHAIIYAEDPDDEQGVYEYYYYIDGDTFVTIYGGTLFGSEPSAEAADVLSNMSIE